MEKTIREARTMKLRIMLIAVTTMLLFVTFSGCRHKHSGGGAAAGQPTQAVVTLFSSGTLTTAVSGIGAIEVTIELPALVTVKSSATPTTDIDVVVPSGAAAGLESLATGIYTAATSTLPATVRVLLTNTKVNGFGTGEFAAVTCDLNGANPAAGDFNVVGGSLVSYGVSTVNTLDISSDLTVGLIMELQ
jgi:hypothetical protein